MTNISKRTLPRKQQQQLLRQLVNVLGSDGADIAGKNIEALLTEAEQIMLMKRLAAVLLLAEGCSAYRVSQILQLSESTAQGV